MDEGFYIKRVLGGRVNSSSVGALSFWMLCETDRWGVVELDGYCNLVITLRVSKDGKTIKKLEVDYDTFLQLFELAKAGGEKDG